MDAVAHSKKVHDASRQERAVLVRLSEAEAALADRLRRDDETRAGLLRRLLAQAGRRSR